MDLSDSKSANVQTSPVMVETAAMMKPLSHAARFAGVFTKPSSTFESLAETGPRKSDWLVPMIMYTLIVFAANMLIYSNPACYKDLHGKVWNGTDQMNERMQSGTISNDDGIKQHIEHSESLGNIDHPDNDWFQYRIINGITLVPTSIILWVGFYFFVVLLFGGKTKYNLVLSAYGLVLYIEIINKLLSVILMMVTGNYAASVAPTLFMKPDMRSIVFNLVEGINPFLIWRYYTLGIAFHKIGGMSKTKGMIASFVPWVLFVVISALVFALL